MEKIQLEESDVISFHSYDKPEEFENIVVRTNPDGSVLRIRDVARVELGAADYSVSSYLNGRPAVAIPVFQLPGTNSIETANAIYAKMKEKQEP